MDIGLSRDEGISFLTDILQLPNGDGSSDFKPDLPTLNKIIRTFLEIIPFQSILIIEQKLEDRHVPTWAEVKEAMFKKQGGVCQQMNGFMFFLLKSLGYDVTLGAATATYSPEPQIDDHVIVYVHNLVKPNDLYLVEVGCGCPAFEAVNLDFGEESKVYTHSYLEYKFFKKDGRITRAHGKGDIRFEREPEPWEIVFGKWYSFYYFETTNLRPFSEFASFYEYTYTHMNTFHFHTSLRAVAFPKGKMFAVLDESILAENEDGKVEKRKLSSDEDIIQSYRKHFPQFEEKTVRKAVEIWRQQGGN